MHHTTSRPHRTSTRPTRPPQRNNSSQAIRNRTELVMPIQRPCLTCRQLHTNPSRCDRCQTQWDKQRNLTREHYKGNYRERAKHIRESAVACWICGQGKRPNDPWTADHLIPTDPNSPLAAAHRSCNSRRGNTPIKPT